MHLTADFVWNTFHTYNYWWCSAGHRLSVTKCCYRVIKYTHNIIEPHKIVLKFIAFGFNEVLILYWYLSFMFVSISYWTVFWRLSNAVLYWGGENMSTWLCKSNCALFFKQGVKTLVKLITWGEAFKAWYLWIWLESKDKDSRQSYDKQNREFLSIIIYTRFYLSICW